MLSGEPKTSGRALEMSRPMSPGPGTERLRAPRSLAPEVDPGRSRSPAAERLGRGGHALCVFILATTATPGHAADAAAALRSWAAPQRLPSGVEVFLVGRDTEGPEDRERGGAGSELLVHGVTSGCVSSRRLGRCLGARMGPERTDKRQDTSALVDIVADGGAPSAVHCALRGSCMPILLI